MTITSKCPHCGAQVVFESGKRVLACKYCDSIVAIQDVRNRKTGSGSEELEDYSLREVSAELKYMANLYENKTNSQGGVLWISENEIVFKPHRFNFGSLEKSYCKFEDICGYSKSGINNFSVFKKNNGTYSEVTYVVWERDAIINNIEYSRRQYFIKRGLEVPALTLGDYRPSPNGLMQVKVSPEKQKWIYIAIAVLIVLLFLLFV